MSWKPDTSEDLELFEQLKSSVLNIDPVNFVESNLTIDGEEFKVSGGYKPFADIYRYICLKAIDQDTLPVIMVKGRQVGATVMAAALECYFMACGLYGNNGRAPMRIMHLFPTLGLAAAYTKDKLTPIIQQSIPSKQLKASGLPKSVMEARMDTSSPANDNLHFKKFLGGNQVWIESTGLAGDRIRGRQLCLDTELPTPNRGFIKLRDLKAGDKLFDENGSVCSVTKLHPVQESPESYRVTFDDGSVVDACAEHLWTTYTKKDRVNGREPSTRNTKEILETLKYGKETNHSIIVADSVDYEEKSLPIDPYLLGFWLGDGDRYGRIETADPEVLENYRHRLIKSSIDKKSSFGISKSRSYRVEGLTTALTKLGLVYNPGKKNKEKGLGFYKKVIPDAYLQSSYEQRVALLQGLMDSDGCCYKDGRCEFVQAEERKELVEGVYELICSLGIKARVKRKESWRYNVRYQDKYQIMFSTSKDVFRLDRKLKNIIKNDTTKRTHRFIRSIERIPSKPMRCITVDSPSHLYLVTKSFIPTHNTVDCLFFDECFPYDQAVETESGSLKIGKLYDMFSNGDDLPLVKTYNESKDIFEYKKVLNAWNRGSKELVLVRLNNRKIRCTANHPFLTTNGWVYASNLKTGDLVLATGTNIGQVNKFLNDDQFQIVLGSFLGDGHLSNHGVSKYRLIEQHGIKQSNYCEWKASMFGAKTTFIKENGYGKKPAVRFSTELFGLDKEIPNNKNTCPQWVLDSLDERGLAIWFMDDGTRAGVFSTCSFDEESQKRMVKKLKSFGIECEYRWYKKKDSGFFSIYLTSDGRSKLFNIVSKYIYDDLSYKVDYKSKDKYCWNSEFKSAGLIPVKSVSKDSEKVVYDIEVQDNHNFIALGSKNSKNGVGVIVHNCQDMTAQAIGAADKIATQARYGELNQGIKVLFGTPKQKGGAYYKMWQSSSQQYFHLHCENCQKHFPLYRPDVDWEEIWLYGYIVRCTHCGHEQDKRKAAAKGKWIPLIQDPDAPPSKMIGFHINQLYIPRFPKEKIIAQKPENHATNTERIYMNEVLGEFYDGEGGTITKQEIIDNCLEDRHFAKIITPSDNIRVYAGFDWGQKANLEIAAGTRQGQSYSCAVVLTAHGPELFSVDFATRLLRNDPQEKKDIVEEMFRRYSVNLAIGDVGDAGDLTHTMQMMYGDSFLGSRASANVNGHIKFRDDIFPKEIVFEKDYYISELFDLLRKGAIKFPQKSYDRVEWLIDHCCSMEVKITQDRSGDPIRRFVKGSTPNDGFMALLNAYIAWKFDVSQKFNIKHPGNMKHEIAQNQGGLGPITGYCPSW